MSKKSWLIVTNKWTYLLLLTIPLGLIKIIYDYTNSILISNPNISQFIFDTFISILIIAIGIIFFIKMNTHSNWMNPNHPKSK